MDFISFHFIDTALYSTVCYLFHAYTILALQQFIAPPTQIHHVSQLVFQGLALVVVIGPVLSARDVVVWIFNGTNTGRDFL